MNWVVAIAIFTSSLTSWSSDSNLPSIHFYQQNPQYNFEYLLPVNVIEFKKSRWSQKNISDNFEEAAEVLAQCGVKLDIRSETISSRNAEVTFDLEGYSDPSEPHDLNGALAISKELAKINVMNIFFIESFDADFRSITATSMPLMRIKFPDQSVTENTVWITEQIETNRHLQANAGGNNSGYSAVAHEMGHVLLNSGHVTEHYVFNLMHESASNLNGRLTQEQCAQIKKSKLLVKLIPPKKISACPQILSSLVSNIFYLDNVANSCVQTQKIVSHLERIYNEASDLNPVTPTDFYLTSISDTIQYLDRHAFEASLVTTYDSAKAIALPIQQSAVLWTHELGHAILNAQLVKDWPWYKDYQNLYASWGRLVSDAQLIEIRSASTIDPKKKLQFENEKKTISNKILQIQKEIALFKDADSISEMLASYHELFADAVALIFYRDPLILRKALANPLDPTGASASPDELQALDERDFSHLRDVKQWNTTEPHAMLTPAQSFFWQQIKDFKPNERTNQELLRLYYSIIKDEILARVSDPNLKNMSVETPNSRLIEKFRLF